MLITDSEPGELFVIRTAGNPVPAHTSGADGMAAGIEYAVTVLEVTDIVVCEHSACGAMTLLAEGHDLPGTPATAAWLRHADASEARTTAAPVGGEKAAAPVPENVTAQLANLATRPRLAYALAHDTATRHGRVYDVPTATVEEAGALGTAVAA